jgi:hypothetical protein
MTGAGLFWEKSTAGWWLVADLFWEKSTAGWWLTSQANRTLIRTSRVLQQVTWLFSFLFAVPSLAFALIVHVSMWLLGHQHVFYEMPCFVTVPSLLWLNSQVAQHETNRHKKMKFPF